MGCKWVGSGQEHILLPCMHKKQRATCTLPDPIATPSSPMLEAPPPEPMPSTYKERTGHQEGREGGFSSTERSEEGKHGLTALCKVRGGKEGLSSTLRSEKEGRVHHQQHLRCGDGGCSSPSARPQTTACVAVTRSYLHAPS